MVSTPTALSSGTSDRILDAAFRRFAELGLSRSTVEDVAREAGLTRQTIYRYFPSKDDLVRALIMREEERFLDGVRVAFAADDDLEEALFNGMLYCVRFAGDHPVLDRMLKFDPETALPYITIRGGAVVDRARKVVAGLIMRKAWVRPDLVEPVADLLVRAFISYTLTPPDRRPEDVTRDLARIATAALTPKKEAKKR